MKYGPSLELNDLIGMTFNAAYELVLAQESLDLRDVTGVIEMDLDYNRLNVRTCDGLITEVDGFY